MTATVHESATELRPTEARARAVANAVYLEHVGGAGDIAAWGMPDSNAARSVAGSINAVLNGLRGELADAAGRAGEYANAVGSENARLRDLLVEAVRELPRWAGVNDDAHGWYVRVKEELGRRA